MREKFERLRGLVGQSTLQSRRAYGRRPADSLLVELSKPDGRIYIGCAGASGRPAWLEGGIKSAWRTIALLHDRAMRA
ncbi:MAG: hypothetical protein VX453_03365 [Acidobacteriota bacterium]|nr:hypothetical protein [Acidobacteriota bacterium]